MLGTSGTWPPAGGATCGYLVSHDGTHLWVDAGTGTFANLQEHIAIADMSAILITHGHPDHFVDMLPCFYARHYGGFGEPGIPRPFGTDPSRRPPADRGQGRGEREE